MIATRERGILFSTECVRRLRDHEKTQTRRPLNPQPEGRRSVERLTERVWTSYARRGDGCWENFGRWKCPYGNVGDRLWVRETWGLSANDHEHQCLCYRADGEDDERNTMRLWSHDKQCWVIHETDCPASVAPEKWTPAIHMPRWASRITLEITDVRVERLRCISTDDIRAEGYPLRTAWHTFVKCYRDPIERAAELRERWHKGWNQMYGTRPGCSWELDPHVWVIVFNVLCPDH